MHSQDTRTLTDSVNFIFANLIHFHCIRVVQVLKYKCVASLGLDPIV